MRRSWMVLFAVALIVPSPAAAVNAVRITQVYGGSGSVTLQSVYSRDYVELLNAALSPVDISGWALEYGSSSGTWGSNASSIFTFPAGTVMAPCSYLLIAMPGTNASGVAFLGSPLPVTPDFEGVAFPSPSGPQLAMSFSNGKVALFTQVNADVLCGSETAGTLVDRVAYGSGNCPEKTASAGLNRMLAAVRKNNGLQDTDDNSADFLVTGTPVLHNSTQHAGCPGPPVPPTNVTATDHCALIEVRWNAVSQATGYRVKRDSVMISGENPIPIPLFNDVVPAAGTHCYSVCAVNGFLDGPYSAPDVCAQATFQPPTVSDLGPQSVVVGGTAQFSVVATGPGIAYTWRHNHSPIPGAPNGPTLVIPNVQIADAGSYDVVVCNPCACPTSQPGFLNVCPPLVIRNPSTVRASFSAASVSIADTVSGATSLAWYRGIVALTDGPKYSGTTTPVLTISNVTFGDVDYYRLKAQWTCGPPRTSSATSLKVLDCAAPFTIDQQPVDQNVQNGEPATLTIAASTTCGSLTYQWARHLKNGNWWSIAGATSPTYTIRRVYADSAGYFRCTVGRIMFPAKFSNVVAINTVPPGLLTVESVPLTCISARVSWTTGVPTTAHVMYGATGYTYPYTTPETPLALSGSAEISIPGSGGAYYSVIATPANGAWLDRNFPTWAAFKAHTSNVSVQAAGSPFTVDLYSTNDGIPIRIRISNSGCLGTQTSIFLTDLQLNGVPPRRPNHAPALPYLLVFADLGPGQTAQIEDLVFSKAEVNRAKGETVSLTGVITYGLPLRTVPFGAKVVIP